MNLRRVAQRALPAPLVNWAKQRAKDVLLGFILPRAYRKACRTTAVDGKTALFVEVDAAQPSESLALMMREVRDIRGCKIDFVSLGAHRTGFPTYVRNSKELARLAARAHYVFICEAVNTLACLPLRPETKIVQLWHGCGAFKRFGLSTAGMRFGDSLRDKQRHPDHANTSLVTVSSPEVVWAYEEAMGFERQPGIVRPLGISRTDAYFDEDHLAQLRNTVADSVPMTRGRRIMVYAPTYRGNVDNATTPSALDLHALEERLGGEWAVLLKHHPHARDLPPVPEELNGFAADVTRELPIDALLAAADVVVTDYSSLIYECSLLGTPMAFFAFDLDDYEDWRGFYYPYDELTPGPVFHDTESLADWIADVDSRFDPHIVDAFRMRFMSSCDGHATTRICDVVFADS